MAHTPEPWEVDRTRDYVRHDCVRHNGLVVCMFHGKPSDQNADNQDLIAAAPELLAEHREWARLLGRFIVEALQGSYDGIDELVKSIGPSILEYHNGEPCFGSTAIAKAEGK